MGFMDEIRKLTHPYDEGADDYDDYDDDYDDEPVAAPATPAPRRSFPRNAGPVDATPRAGAAAPTAAPTPTGRVMNLSNSTQLQVILVKPERFDQVSDIADHLREKKAVVLNLENTNKDVARRLVDFLSGCAYALDGKIKKVAISTYLITPFNVTVAGDLAEELENSGMYF